MSYRAEEAARRMNLPRGQREVPTTVVPVVPVVRPVAPVVRPIHPIVAQPARTIPIPVEQLGKDAEHNIESPVYTGPDLTEKDEVGTLVEQPVKPVR